VIGLGLAALGRPGYLNLGHGDDLGGDRSVAAMRAHAHDVMDAAYAGGVRHFDAARSYGRAEDFLGAWLQDRRPEGVTISSKWGYTYTADWEVEAEEHEVKDLGIDNLRRQAAESRERLGDWLDLYQIHSATLDSGVLDDRAVLDELAALRAGGLRIGLSVTGPEQAATVERALAVGGFDSVQATWNLHERAAEEALAAAHAAGLQVIVKEALANGRLTARGADPALAKAASEAGTTPDALAIAAALAQPWAGVVLSGAASVATLESNLTAGRIEWTDALERRLDGLREPPRAYWERRSAMRWN
jgi:aryl-alcohol dehydrogenase-like predicted oxidoreductase